MAIIKKQDGTVIWDGVVSPATGVVASVLQDVRARSITPTSFVEREFELDCDNPYFVDRYDCAGSLVVRFGINKHKPGLLADIASEVGVIPQAPSNASYKPADAAAVRITGLEGDLVGRAIAHLLNHSLSAVVVDIFNRDQSAKIGAVQQKDGLLCTHSVVLYHNRDNAGLAEVLVIDPSNFVYSSHLSNIVDSCSRWKIVTFHNGKGSQIYKPLKDDVGPGYKQFRDCVDIASKVVVGLQSAHVKYQFSSIEEILKCDIVQNLSNISDRDSSIIEPKVVTRVKQSSDIKEVKHFNKIEKFVKTLHKVMESAHIDTLDKARDDCKVVLESNVPHRDVISSLSQHAKWCLDEVNTKLSGEYGKFLHDAGVDGIV